MRRGSPLLDYPTLDITLRAAEIHPDAEHTPGIGGKRVGITAFGNLAERLFGCAVQLKFHHVDEAVGLKHQVYPTAGSVIFHPGVETHEAENDEKYILIMQLQVADQLVRRTGHKAPQAAEERLGIAEIGRASCRERV